MGVFLYNINLHCSCKLAARDGAFLYDINLHCSCKQAQVMGLSPNIFLYYSLASANCKRLYFTGGALAPSVPVRWFALFGLNILPAILLHKLLYLFNKRYFLVVCFLVEYVISYRRHMSFTYTHCPIIVLPDKFVLS